MNSIKDKKNQSLETKLECLQGTVRKIIFSSEESGFAVISAASDVTGDEETVVGSLAALNPGENIKFFGQRVNSAKFGKQFKCEYYEVVYPGTKKGIVNFLSSGFIHGVGQAYAERIVEKFGLNTIEILTKTPELLAEVPGIGKKRLKQIKESWEKHKAIRDVMVFLQSYDISAAYASRIYRVYHHLAVEKMRENPYSLATDVPGIGFLMADAIARKLGFSKESPQRAESAVLYILSEVMDNGHTFYPLELLSRETDKLDIPRDIFHIAVERLSKADWIKIAEVSTGEKGVYLTRMYSAEKSVSRELKRIKSGDVFLKGEDTERIVREIEGLNRISFSEGQYSALRAALSEKLLVITGGPGTGKTTLIRGIVQAFNRYNGDVFLAAPTGRAAKRLSSASEHEAKTIHRLLEYNPQTNAFGRFKDRTLECNAVIIDEVSMVDILLMYHLLQAIDSRTSLILVGDADQLPSVGPGNVLRDIISSGKVPVVTLKHIFRQKKGSEIVLNAHNINQGKMVQESSEKPENRHFFFIKKNDPQSIRETIEELVRERIPKTFHLNSHSDIQVITPMHRGVVGVEQLNQSLQKILNPRTDGIQKRNMTFKVSDKVMQTVNDYDKDVFNGDIGFIEKIDKEAGVVIVDYEGRKVSYDMLELDEMVLAYAVSVHKAQGGEYRCVIMPVTNQHFIMLQRNLLYTAVTRGRELVILVGEEDALKFAIRNDRMLRRYTDLQWQMVLAFEEDMKKSRQEETVQEQNE